jgi:hypothetical protein
MKFVIICLLVINSAFPALALDQEMILGRGDNWRDIVYSSGIRFESGKRGYTDIFLADGEYRADPATDLLLHFNRTPLVDDAGSYRVEAPNAEVTERVRVFGSGAGVFRRSNAVSLVPGEKSLFGRGRSWGDFSLEFWLYPAALEDGEVILSWKGAEEGNDRFIPQMIRCSVLDRRLVWEFSNVFTDFLDPKRTIRFEGMTALIPREWNHHLVRFDGETGLIEYLVDGEPEAVIYASRSGEEDGSVFLPSIGSYSAEPLEIAPVFTGFIDELRLVRDFVEDPALDRYSETSGTMVTRPLDLGYSGSRVKRIEADSSIPSDGDIYYYYILSENAALHLPDDPGWRIFEPGEPLPDDAEGRFLTLMTRLFPDGRERRSPVLSEMRIIYQPDFPPQTPAAITADPGNGSVTLTWSRVTDDDLAGYLVYYGTRPGRYFGTDSGSGPSPVDAGMSTELTLEGLANGKLYYFSVVAYDDSTPSHRSGFSDEVSARPSMLEEDR